MTWQPEIDELAYRKQLASALGGAEKVARHKAAGKLTVRERIATCADPESFHEIGALTGTGQYDAQGKLIGLTPANLVIGRARISGRPVVLVGDDFTVRGGANDGSIGDKLIYAEKMARDLRLPMVRLVDGTGGGGSVRNIETKGHTLIPTMKVWQHVVENMSLVPVVSLALGSVAGMGAARVAASHYSVMVKDSSQLFNAGPPVVARAGQHIEKNDLGGSHIHTRNGVVDDEAASEADALERVRRFLSYLPSNVFELPPRGEINDDTNRRDEWLLSAIPRNSRSVYKIRPIVETLVDNGSFMEMGRYWGKGLVTGLARIDGWPVAVVASDPYHYGGGWDGPTAEKFTRFVDLAEVFHLPVLNLVDIAGFQIGLEAEKAGIMRYGVRALAAVYQTTTPWCSLILRRAYGVAAAGHQHMGRYNFRYAWPSGNWGSLPIEGGLDVAYKAEIEGADDPVQKRAEIEQRVRSLTSPFRSAEAFVIEDIIDPRDTRRLLCEFANLAAPLREPGIRKFGIRP
ncbi:methylmalonyl-CoA carboxyltransferase [Pollutimonas subterranea]|uniref:Methylmalonyl-CoA carboxyltransferase n=1 Tax=Pollutimonas subterranea TaxID=2045210 RepID=A0A2N4U060_9BURK|nr:carboxyl transferase domain-containing protein [Pollutimonas subterranea]PLC48400.1 methylmalonyl-CoA carboxyltransferase [Pollutimonas subterranea]